MTYDSVDSCTWYYSMYFTLFWFIMGAYICFYFLPCCRWHFPKRKKLLCLLFQDSSALDASLRLLGNNITIQYVENKQMQNPLLFVFLAHPGHMELGSYTNTAVISNIRLTQGAFWHSSQTWNCFSQTLWRHCFSLLSHLSRLVQHPPWTLSAICKDLWFMLICDNSFHPLKRLIWGKYFNCRARAKSQVTFVSTVSLFTGGQPWSTMVSCSAADLLREMLIVSDDRIQKSFSTDST